MHLVRHYVGINHFVSTQRSDRTKIKRDNLPQNNVVSYSIRLNAQSIINISRKRLCEKASVETRIAWLNSLLKLKEIDPILYSICQRECIYRGGHCREMKCCGYIKTENFREELNKYLNQIKYSTKGNMRG